MSYWATQPRSHSNTIGPKTLIKHHSSITLQLVAHSLSMTRMCTLRDSLRLPHTPTLRRPGVGPPRDSGSALEGPSRPRKNTGQDQGTAKQHHSTAPDFRVHDAPATGVQFAAIHTKASCQCFKLLSCSWVGGSAFCFCRASLSIENTLSGIRPSSSLAQMPSRLRRVGTQVKVSNSGYRD